MPAGPDAAALAAINGTLGGISGVTDVAYDVIARPGGGHLIQLSHKGWGPSLHRCAITTGIDVPDGPGDFTLRALEALDPHVAMQRDLLSDGLSLDTPVPFDAYRPDNVSHVLLDRDLVALILAEPDTRSKRTQARETPARRVAKALARALAIEEPVTDGSAVHDGDHVWLHRLGRGRVVAGFDLPLRRPSDPEGLHATFDGRTVRIQGTTLPESTLHALVGRPLGDYAALHPSLDARTIVAAHASGWPHMPAIDLSIDTIPATHDGAPA